MNKTTELTKHWSITLPETFHRMYRAFEYPIVGSFEFLAPDAMLEDSERWRGMLPQFHPIARNLDDTIYGFYAVEAAMSSECAVLAWNQEYDHYYPVASGFAEFLRWCIITGLYEAQDSDEDEGLPYEVEMEQYEEFVRLVGLPDALIQDPLPRNERELHERILASDPLAAVSNLQLGAHWFRRGSFEQARVCFLSATDATPWFSDAHYLAAAAYRAETRQDEAIARWWRTVQCPITLSTNTGAYDLGNEQAEAEIHEAVVDHLLVVKASLPDEIRDSPLFRVLSLPNAFAPSPRLALADELANRGDALGAERELLNALALATEEDEIDAAYDGLIAHYERAGLLRDAAFCRKDREMEA